MLLLSVVAMLVPASLLHAVSPTLILWTLAVPFALDGGSGLLVAAVSFLAFASFAVNWQRYLLLGDVAGGLQLLRLDRPVWVFLASLLVIAAVASLAGFAVNGLTAALAPAAASVHWSISFLAGTALALPVMALVQCLALCLPATAQAALYACLVQKRDV